MRHRARTWWTWTSIQQREARLQSCAWNGPLALRIAAQVCMVLRSTFGRTTGPLHWAASLRTAGRTFRLPLQMIDTEPAPTSGVALVHPAVKGHPMATGTVKWFNEQ